MTRLSVSPMGSAIFWCPACQMHHHFYVQPATKTPVWEWNGSEEFPTVKPSIRVQGVVPITDEEAARVFDGERIEPRPLCCHSIITDGRIAYCDDCTHGMAGHTVLLPEWEGL